MKSFLKKILYRLISVTSSDKLFKNTRESSINAEISPRSAPGKTSNNDRTSTAYEVGNEIDGIVTGIEHYGIFIRLPNGESGLVFKNEICWPGESVEPQIGDKLRITVMGFKEGRGLALSIREPRAKAVFLEFTRSYPVGSKFSGIIKSIMDYGLFVTLSPGVTGLLHISTLPDIASYDRGMIGKVIDVHVLSIEIESARISLGLQL